MLRNIFACLVHEEPDCVLDLVRNLRYLDPSSSVLLYNGSEDPMLTESISGMKDSHVFIHPDPKPVKWGRLHGFAIDSMQFLLQTQAFDTVTFVDSDQLAIKHGYSEFLNATVSRWSEIGMLGRQITRVGDNAPVIMPKHSGRTVATSFFQEIDLWQPYFRRFTAAESDFPYWVFWPSTVITANAARQLVTLFTSDFELQSLFLRSQTFATEEIILPTLIALLGFRVTNNPCSYEYVRYRTLYTIEQICSAFRKPDVFWIHPIPRVLEDPLRSFIRDHFNQYSITERN